MIECSECGKEFESESELEKHIEEEHPSGFIGGFLDFLEQYGVVGVAIAFIIGLAVKDLVSALVDDVIMPFIEILLPGGNWQTATVTFGTATFKVGHLLAALIDFIIIALLVFIFFKHVMRKKRVEKI